MSLREERIARFSAADIYPVISSEFCSGRDIISVLKQVAVAGARLVQLREKNKSKKEIWQLALEYRKITSEYGMLLIINDHLDIALAASADGVHLGQDDLPLEAALETAPELLIGVSTHSKDEALEAQSKGAGYINIGPVFPTRTKNLPMDSLGTEVLKETVPQLRIPFSVMGGIKEKHIPGLLELGARRIAMVTEITQAPDICAKVKALRRHWKS